MKKINVMGLVLVLAAGFGNLLAQGRGPGRPAEGPAPAPKALFQLDGEVQQVDVAIGQRNLSIMVGGDTVVLAPQFDLERHDFTVEPGDWVRAEVFESPGRGGFLLATKVLNVTRNQTAELRDGSGQPLWRTARRGARGRLGRGPCGGVVRDVDAAETFTDIVSEAGTESGPRYPRVTLSSGRTLAMGPYRVWTDQGFEVSVGDEVEVTAYPCSTGADRWVVMAVDNLTTGKKLQLRDEAGFPAPTRGWGVGGVGRR